MTRGISDPVPSPTEQEEQQEISNEDVMNFVDQVALLVRDLDTRISTLERLFMSPPAIQEEAPKKKRFLDGR